MAEALLDLLDDPNADPGLLNDILNQKESEAVAAPKDEAAEAAPDTSYPFVDRGDYILHPRNSWDPNGDPDDPVLKHVSGAEIAFWRGIAPNRQPKVEQLIEINYIENKRLKEQFQRKKQWLADNGLDDSVAVLFHGTRSDTVHEICSGNFRLDMGTRFAYGRGIYFSRCPNVSLDYGTDLILCKVLTGRKQPMARYEKLQDNYDSFEVSIGSDPLTNYIVIKSEEQVLPYCTLKTVSSTGPRRTQAAALAQARVRGIRAAPASTLASAAGALLPTTAAPAGSSQPLLTIQQISQHLQQSASAFSAAPPNLQAIGSSQQSAVFPSASTAAAPPTTASTSTSALASSYQSSNFVQAMDWQPDGGNAMTQPPPVGSGNSNSGSNVVVGSPVAAAVTASSSSSATNNATNWYVAPSASDPYGLSNVAAADGSSATFTSTASTRHSGPPSVSAAYLSDKASSSMKIRVVPSSRLMPAAATSTTASTSVGGGPNFPSDVGKEKGKGVGKRTCRVHVPATAIASTSEAPIVDNTNGIPLQSIKTEPSSAVQPTTDENNSYPASIKNPVERLVKVVPTSRLMPVVAAAETATTTVEASSIAQTSTSVGVGPISKTGLGKEKGKAIEKRTRKEHVPVTASASTSAAPILNSNGIPVQSIKTEPSSNTLPAVQPKTNENHSYSATIKKPTIISFRKRPLSGDFS